MVFDHRIDTDRRSFRGYLRGPKETYKASTKIICRLNEFKVEDNVAIKNLSRNKRSNQAMFHSKAVEERRLKKKGKYEGITMA